MKQNLIFLSLVLILAACGGKNENKETQKTKAKESNKKVNIKKEIVGQWKNSNIHVTMKTAKGDSILVANNKNWQELLKIKPIVTIFKNNGTFKSTYKGLDDKVIMTNEGSWEVKGDSLFMTQNDKVTGYHVNINESKATFKSVLDWDQDGEMDDIYLGRQTKIVKKKKENK